MLEIHRVHHAYPQVCNGVDEGTGVAVATTIASERFNFSDQALHSVRHLS